MSTPLVSTEPRTPGDRKIDLPAFRLFGLTLVSDFPFASCLLPGAGPPDLSFTCTKEPAPLRDCRPAALLYASPYRTEDGESLASLYSIGSCKLLRVARVADFALWPDRIVGHLPDAVDRDAVDHNLLGMVLSLWLEQKGIRMLHATGMVVNGGIVSCVADCGNGKSTLAAAFLKAGFPLLTDDLLPLEFRSGAFVGQPAYPQMRLWPDEARHFLGRCDHLPRVHPTITKRRVPVGVGGFGSFCDAPRPLACIYLPERRDPVECGTEIAITRVSPRDAVMQLVRHSFTPNMVHALGLQPDRLDFFVRLALQLPIRRVTYPSGFGHLPRVVEAILADVERVTARCGRGGD